MRPVGIFAKSSQLKFKHQTAVKRLTNPIIRSAGFSTRFSQSSIAAAIALILGGLPTVASATAIDPNVSISGAIDFSSSGTLANASQSQSITQIISSTTSTTASFSGTLNDIGDGFGFNFSANGSSISNADSQINDLFGDYSMSLTNNSATDTFIVNLKLAFDNSVDASGNDAFALSQIALNDAANADLFFNGLQSDTNGNFQYEMPDSFTNIATGAGGPLSSNGFYILQFILTPNAVIDLGNTNAELTVRGGSFGGTGQFSANVSMLLTVDSVSRQQTPPPPTVPEPETFLLLLIGFASLRISSKRI